MFFKLLHTSLKSNARIGKIQTDRGIINTPVFMPVGTQGTIKSAFIEDVISAGSQIILSKNYQYSNYTTKLYNNNISKSHYFST